MYSVTYGDYLENEILNAEPIQLVQLMYRGALEALGGARRALASGDIAGRSKLISKASAIINELALSLNRSADPELCQNLVELYDYMLRRLIEANSKQIEEPLAEVGRLMGQLYTAWSEIGRIEQADDTASCAPAVYAGSGSGDYRPISYAC